MGGGGQCLLVNFYLTCISSTQCIYAPNANPGYGPEQNKGKSQRKYGKIYFCGRSARQIGRRTHDIVYSN